MMKTSSLCLKSSGPEGGDVGQVRAQAGAGKRSLAGLLYLMVNLPEREQCLVRWGTWSVKGHMSERTDMDNMEPGSADPTER